MLIIANKIIETWSSLWKIFKETLVENLDLSIEGAGPELRTWQNAGIQMQFDLCGYGNFRTSESLRVQIHFLAQTPRGVTAPGRSASV